MSNIPTRKNLTETYGCCFAVHDFANFVMLCVKIELDDKGNIHCTDFTGWTKVFEFQEIKQIENITLFIQNYGD